MNNWQKQFDEKFALENTWTGKKQFQVIISAYTKDIKTFISKVEADVRIKIKKTILDAVEADAKAEGIASVIEKDCSDMINVGLERAAKVAESMGVFKDKEIGVASSIAKSIRSLKDE